MTPLEQRPTPITAPAAINVSVKHANDGVDMRTRIAVAGVLRALLALVDVCEIYLEKKRTADIRREWKELHR